MVLIEEFTEVKHLLILLLDSLRIDGESDKEMYGTAERVVEEHMNNIENHLKQKIKDII